MIIFTSFLLFTIYLYTALFIVSHFFVIAGMFSCFRREKKADSFSMPLGGVSVIVPARDEADRLPALFESLLSQSYDNFEIILINDRSDDGTLSLMNSFMNAHPGRVKVIDNKNSYNGKNPKQMALSLAEGVASGDFFLYTDADCRVPEKWVEYMIRPFADPATGLVFGTVTVNGRKTLLEKFQQYDHILRYHYTAACAGLDMPTGGFGNNLAVRRKALFDVGGFEKLEYTVTEDAQLIAKIRDSKKWKIFAQTSAKSVVSTAPVENWKELYIQELRWSTGAIHAPDINSRIGYGFVMYQLFAGIAVFVPAFFNPLLFSVFFTGIVCMFAVSFTAGRHLKMEKPYWVNLPVSLFISEFLFPLVTARASFKPSIIWKGNRLDS